MLRPLLLVPLIGCAANSGDGGMIVLNNSAAVDTCSFSGDMNQPFIASGTLFLDSPAPYLLTPLIESKIESVMGQDLQRTVEFRGAKIDLTLSTISLHNGNPSSADFTPDELSTLHDEGVTHFKSLFSGSLPPAGFANVGFDIIPLQLLDAIKAKVAGNTGDVSVVVAANIVVYGVIGGDEVDADLFVYPVTVCTNCIVNVVGSCPLPSGSMIVTGNPCNPFQDGVVDCCTSTNGTICPATISTM